MTPEFIDLYEKHIRYARTINETNIDAFKRCCYILFAVDICSTCSSTISTYYGKMKEFYDRQLLKDLQNPPEVKEITNEVIIETTKPVVNKNKKK